MLLCASKNLPAIRLALSERGGDLRIFVVEDFAEQEDRALGRTQSFEQDEKRDRQSFLRLHVVFAGDERFRQPLSDILLAPIASGLQMIDRETGDDRDEKGFRR